MFKQFIPLFRRGFLYECNKAVLKRTSECWFDTMPVVCPVIQFQNFHIDSRHDAKGKDIKKNKKKSTFIDENELSEFFDTEKLFSHMSKPIEHLKREFIDHTTLRTSQGAIDNVRINFEGKIYSIQDVADITKKNPKLYVLDLSLFPQMIPVVMSTLQESDMNINVQQDGTKIFVPIPKVTKEHRQVLAKKANVFFIKCKDNIRDVQMKYIKKLRTDENLSTEVKTRIIEQLTALGDKNIKIAEDLLKVKQNELLQSETSS